MKLAFLAKTQILSTNSANVAFSLKIQENQEHENLHFFERLFQFELHLKPNYFSHNSLCHVIKKE